MARHQGMPGRTLVYSVVGLVLVPVATGFGVYLLLGAVSPMLRIAAPLAGLWAFMAVLRSRSFEKEFVAKARGAIGENAVGRALHRLPTGWRVFHDVQLEHENIDHVVVSSRGVFTIEVKNYSGKIKVGPSGIFTHGQRNDRIVRQAWRQAHRLREVLDVDIQPLLVFVGREIAPTRVGSLLVMADHALVPWLLHRTKRAIDLETGRRLIAVLESHVAGTRMPTASPPDARAGEAKPLGKRTSRSHPLQVAWVHGLTTAGALGMTSAPGRHEPSARGYRWARDLHTDLARLVTVHRANVLVVLMERHEYALLEVSDLVERAAGFGITVQQFAIANASVPRPEQALAFDALVAGIRSELEAGKRVVLQCRDGVSRSGLVAAAVATTFGDAAEVAVERVRMVHPRAVATPEQEAFITAFAARAGGG